jgi:hypothetical protein
VQQADSATKWETKKNKELRERERERKRKRKKWQHEMLPKKVINLALHHENEANAFLLIKRIGSAIAERVRKWEKEKEEKLISIFYSWV